MTRQLAHRAGSVPATPPDGDWTSWHLHTDSAAPGVLDRVVVDVVAPVLARRDVARRRWFFVRYWQRGPHVRLRVSGLSRSTADRVAAELADRLAQLDQAVPHRERIDPDAYRAAMARVAAAGEGDGPLPLGELRPAGVHRETYEPEYQRYGGRAAMELSESLFHQSSVLAVGLLRASTAAAGVSRNAIGLNALTAGLSALHDASGAEVLPVARCFAERAVEVWSRYAAALSDTDLKPALSTMAHSDAARIAQAPEALLRLLTQSLGAWGRWSAGLREAYPVWQATGSGDRILRSHLHMMANRLGLEIGEELYLWMVLVEFLCLVDPARSAPTPGRRL